ncbi:5-oxoprolinase subunit C family protein [Agarivorans gilvus]|jgi:biotin-dependent carboxylase-like uncharacterized protein|uniref:Allophanate hydrolase n=1 Tax=Agarivorans gilvus TaxID=680279 RepID=A0ABQ1HXB5_9ALTE|nr:biotin-dependent carboxyltransferase family protein [Agarivorans gilvus]GGA92980.1 allophanate hydrolase [Agarivorans gilvus]
MASLQILRSGPHSLVIDRGRNGFQDIGVSPGGAADQHAYNWANRLVGNPANSAALEITFGGVELQFSHACRIAVCGAKMPLSLSQANSAKQVDLWQTIDIQAEQILKLAPAPYGLRSYLAIQGGLRVHQELNSYSSSPKQGLGPFNGRALKAGDQLPYLAATQFSKSLPQQTPARFIPDYQQPLKLALIPGYQFSLFSPQQIDLLTKQTYQISDLSDRMGIRLEGEAFATPPKTLESEAIAQGAVQVPPNGLPIILSVDRQTVGGYPKLGCISRLDLFALNQRRAQQTVQFYISSQQQQRQRWLAFERYFSW